MKVLFVCSGGMSSTIAVNALKKEAEKHGEKIEVLAIGTQAVDDEVKNGWNCVMVAPQIRHRFENIKAAADAQNIPCALIEPMAYSPLGGPKLYTQMKVLTGGK